MKILFVILLALGCYANPTGSELKKTPSTVFDFTMVPSNDIKETLQDMIMVEIGKELFLERRKNNLWQCQVDQFGTDYCPTGLAPAKPYTAYYQSTTYERESAVMDYQTGSATSSTGSVVDYASKVATPYYTNKTSALEVGRESGRLYEQTISWSPLTESNTVRFLIQFSERNNCGGDSIGSCNIGAHLRVKNGVLEVGRESGRLYEQTISWSPLTESNTVRFLIQFSERNNCGGDSIGSCNIGAHLRVKNGVLEVGRESGRLYEQTISWSPLTESNTVRFLIQFSERNNCGGDSIGSCNIGAHLRGKYSCPSGTVLEGSQCKGINYVCSSGYTDNGSNCKKTVNYALYQYTCPSGYTVANAGLTTCTKTDPNTTTDNTSTLDDACNSATPPTGNCSKSISYKYYEYLCQSKNSFLEPIKNLNTGLNACSKTDSDKTKDNTGTLDDACNSSTPPTNNCQSTEYTCNSALFKPVYVGGKWVCSPYLCNDDMKCGYGTCDLPTTPSTTKYQDIAYNPLGTVNNNKCNGDICDFVVNARVTYCESKQCPKGDDIIEKNGKCYKLECPAGTYLSGEKCIKVN